MTECFAGWRKDLADYQKACLWEGTAWDSGKAATGYGYSDL